MTRVEPPPALRADCTRCAGLCCVVPAFAKSADFAVDKPAGTPCANLLPDSRCGIHTRLRESGFPGCTVYDCFGAGQHVTEVVLSGRDWRTDPTARTRMAEVFPHVRDLHELLHYLREASSWPESAMLSRRLAALTGEVLAARADAASADVAGLRARVSALTAEAVALVRPPGPDHRGANLIGARLRGADLRAASLRGALLIGADLREAVLVGADVIGADFRSADLRGADLSGALFLTQMQVDAARGSSRTRLPGAVRAPGHWS
ncbi:pentapeptide repeat-containing protein [Actinokineospora bangkokensis]|uniref:pentapeptide repeat-containing protein n=1 Tax=Actinokineospora bangkokensis TaxID=1193682 RepID=UPI000B2CD866|nr:pentapeptide repeat-containing protein [Actinokineospora bangkokensis]